MNALVELPQLPIMTVEAMTERINAIQTVTRNKMINEVHYGTIPGTKKPTLYKAGSEMLLVMFQIGPELQVDDLSTADRIKYRVTVTGIHTPTGRAIGQGVGECSSSEEKYKWRKALCDDEFDAAPETHRRIKWAKSYNGPVYQEKQIRTVPDDLGNTVLKMAKKRAQIDMTLTALGVSDLFNQDIEDLPVELRQGAEDGTTGGAMGPIERNRERSLQAIREAKTVKDLERVRKECVAELNRLKDRPFYDTLVKEIQARGAALRAQEAHRV